MPTMNFSPYDAEQRELDRRAQYAELLRQQGMEAPQGGMAGRIYVGPSWTQGLAQMLKAYGGGKGVRMADEQSRELAAQRHKEIADALRGYGAGGDAVKLLESPDTAAFGMQAMGQERQAQIDALTRSDDRRWRAEQDIADRKWRTEQELLQRQWQAEQNDLNRNARIQAANMGGGAPDPYYQFLPGADGYLVGNARTGQITPGMVNGQRAVPGALDVALQGQLAGAKTAAQTEAEITTKREQNMSGIGDTIARAREILESGKPTQSTVGTAIDAGGRLFGMTPDGAPEADQLRVLGGALIAKMPRMEGPQSNLDVQNYREMAGQVGDSTLPIERRLAALAEVERLYAKYANQPAQQSGASGSWSDGAAISTDEEYDALPSGATFVGPDGVTRRKP